MLRIRAARHFDGILRSRMTAIPRCIKHDTGRIIGRPAREAAFETGVGVDAGVLLQDFLYRLRFNPLRVQVGDKFLEFRCLPRVIVCRIDCGQYFVEYQDEPGILRRGFAYPLPSLIDGRLIGDIANSEKIFVVWPHIEALIRECPVRIIFFGDDGKRFVIVRAERAGEIERRDALRQKVRVILIHFGRDGGGS